MVGSGVDLREQPVADKFEAKDWRVKALRRENRRGRDFSPPYTGQISLEALYR